MTSLDFVVWRSHAWYKGSSSSYAIKPKKKKTGKRQADTKTQWKTSEVTLFYWRKKIDLTVVSVRRSQYWLISYFLYKFSYFQRSPITLRRRVQQKRSRVTYGMYSKLESGLPVKGYHECSIAVTELCPNVWKKVVLSFTFLGTVKRYKRCVQPWNPAASICRLNAISSCYFWLAVLLFFLSFFHNYFLLMS